MSDHNHEQQITELLEELKTSPERDLEATAKGRMAFLAEADQLARQPVSISPIQRLINSFRKPQPRLRFSTFTIGFILAVLMLTFSSSVFAARNARPNQFLYPFKLWLETSRLSLTQRPESQINLRLEYAEERLAELEGFSENLADPAIAITVNNYDDQIKAIEGLMETYEPESSQRERLERVKEEYYTFYPEEKDEDDEQEDSELEELEEETGEPSEDELEEIKPAEESEADDPEKTESETEDSETDTPEGDDDTEEKTKEPDPSDDDSEKEDKTPEPIPDETDDPDSDD